MLLSLDDVLKSLESSGPPGGGESKSHRFFVSPNRADAARCAGVGEMLASQRPQAAAEKYAEEHWKDFGEAPEFELFVGCDKGCHLWTYKMSVERVPIAVAIEIEAEYRSEGKKK